MTQHENTIETFESILFDRAFALFQAKTHQSKEYIVSVCLHHIKNTNKDIVYQQYERIIERVLKCTFESLLTSYPKILLSPFYDKSHKLHYISNIISWRLLNKKEKLKAFKNLVFQKENHNNFFDLRMVDTPNKFKISHLADDNLNISSGDIENKISISDITLIVTKHLDSKVFNYTDSAEKVAKEIIPLIDELIYKKKLKNKKRVEKISDSVTLTILVKKIRDGSAKEYILGNHPFQLDKKNKITDLKDLVHLIVLDNHISLEEIKSILKLPLRKQVLQLKLCLYKAMVAHSPSRHDYIDKALYKHKFSLPSKVIKNINNVVCKKVKDISILSLKERVDIFSDLTSHLKKIKSLSGHDLTLFSGMLIRRANYILSRSQGDPFNNDFIHLYFNLRDNGVTRSKIRNLLKAIYLNYTPTLESLNERHNRHHHDFLTFYENKIISFFNCLNGKVPPNKLNKIVTILSNEISGAQGNSNSAFKSWKVLWDIKSSKYRLPDDFNSFKEIESFLLFDPVIIKNIIKETNKLKSSFSSESISQYAVNSKVSKGYLSRLIWLKSNKPIEMEYETPKTYISKNIGDVFVDILPNSEILGHLGCSVNGVCIDFNSVYHKEHNSSAVSNLIVRDNENILIWGLIVRVQEKAPLYYLNNVQGSLPTKYAKHGKHLINKLIRSALNELGPVVSLDFFFNAISIINDDDPLYKKDFTLPKMRLDVPLLEITDSELVTVQCGDHIEREFFLID